MCKYDLMPFPGKPVLLLIVNVCLGNLNNTVSVNMSQLELLICNYFEAE